MRTATAIPVPHGPVDLDFIRRVNQRAGRQVITTHKINDQPTYVTNAGTTVKAGQFVLITDALGSTNAALYQIVDRMGLRMTPPKVKEKTEAQAAFDRLAPTLREQTLVMWRCTSCGEMWAGKDMEHDVHVHGSYEPGTHRITGPLFRDPDAEAEVRAAWAKEDGHG